MMMEKESYEQMNELRGTTMRVSISNNRFFYVAMILIYCLLYEWGNIFSVPGVKIYVNMLKLIFPFILFLGLPSRLLPNLSLPKKYLFYFAVFMAWGLVPNIFSGHLSETMLQWMKFILRFFFCYVIFAYLLQRSEAKTTIMKALVAIALGVVLQYVILCIFYVPGDPRGLHLPILQPTTYFGPYGFLGDGNASLIFQGLNHGLFRLTGFWFEPSSASGFLFMAFFLARALFEQTRQIRWNLFGLICLVGGLFAFSNAGQLALGCAILFWLIVRFKEKRKSYFRNIIKVIIVLACIFIIVFGRAIVVKHCSGNMNLRNLLGVRDIGEDAYGGRIEQLGYNKDLILKHPAGIGFRIMGKDAKRRGVSYAGSAPLAWLVCTGWIGLFLLLMREAQVLQSSWKRPLSSNSISIFQAWIVLFCQNLSLGTWMTPLYFLLVTMVFTTIYYPNDAGGIRQDFPA